MSYSTYSRYRDSGFNWIGKIPDNWEVRRLKDVLDSPVTDGPHSTPEFLYEGIPFLSVDGIQDGELQFEGCRYVSIEDHRQFAKKSAPRKGDVLLGKAASTGKIAQVKVDFEFNIWSPLALLRPNQAEITPTYLEYALKSPAVQAQIDVLCTHNTQSNISMDDIPKLVLPLPSGVEQQQIAAFLDWKTGQIDALIAKKKELMEKLKEKRLAVITQAVTKGLDPLAPMRDSGTPWLGDVPRHWEVKRFKFLASIRYGLGEPPEYVNEGLNLIRATDVFRGSIARDRFKKIRPEDVPWERRPALQKDEIIVVRSGAYTGDSAIVPRELEGAIAGFDMVVTATDMQPELLAWALLSPYLLEAQIYQARLRAAQPHLNSQELGNFIVFVPPKSEQQLISTYINEQTLKMDALMSKVVNAITHLTEYRTALITAATTGKIDVRHIAIPAPT